MSANPTGSFALHAADLSATHACVVDEYRAACKSCSTCSSAWRVHARSHAIERLDRVFECLAEADVSTATDETAA